MPPSAWILPERMYIILRSAIQKPLPHHLGQASATPDPIDQTQTLPPHLGQLSGTPPDTIGQTQEVWPTYSRANAEKLLRKLKNDIMQQHLNYSLRMARPLDDGYEITLVPQGHAAWKTKITLKIWEVRMEVPPEAIRVDCHAIWRPDDHAFNVMVNEVGEGGRLLCIDD